jgi:hypothetical protein
VTIVIIALTTVMVPAQAMVAHGLAGMVAVQPVAAAVAAGMACTGVPATYTAAVATAVSAAISATATVSTTATATAILRVCGPHDRQAIRQ